MKNITKALKSTCTFLRALYQVRIFFFTFDFKIKILRTAKILQRDPVKPFHSFPQCLHFPLTTAQYNNQESNAGIMHA